MRFFIELVIVLVIGYLIILLGKRILKYAKADIFIKTVVIKLIVFVITGVIYLIGRNKTWAVDCDERVVEWGNKSLEQPSDKWSTWRKVRKVLFVCLIIFTYLWAIIPDLPLSKEINPYYMKNVSVAKEFFQNLESRISEKFKGAPPIIMETSKNLPVKKEKVIYLSLIDRKGKKIPIQKSPRKESKVIGKIGSRQKVVYKNQHRNVGKKHWLKVYVVKTKKVGWIDSSFVKKKQVEKLLRKE